MQKFLLTGQIGAGKSTVLELLAGEHVLTVSADRLVHNLYKEQPEIWTRIEQSLGMELRNSKGEADKAKLAKVIFTNKSALDQVEKIVHPLVAALLQKLVDASAANFLIYENAVVRNPDDYSNFNGVIYLQAEEQVRINRLMARGMDLSDIHNRLQNEVPLSSFRIPVYKIENSASLTELTAQIEKLKAEIGMAEHD